MFVLTDLAEFASVVGRAYALDFQVFVRNASASVLAGLRGTWQAPVSEFLEDVTESLVHFFLFVVTALPCTVYDALDGFGGEPAQENPRDFNSVLSINQE